MHCYQAYRFTDLSQLNDSECAAPRGAALERVAQAVESVATTESDTLRLVVVDGVFSPSISQMDGLDDSVFVGSTRSYNEDATVLKLSLDLWLLRSVPHACALPGALQPSTRLQ